MTNTPTFAYLLASPRIANPHEYLVMDIDGATVLLHFTDSDAPDIKAQLEKSLLRSNLSVDLLERM